MPPSAFLSRVFEREILGPTGGLEDDLFQSLLLDFVPQPNLQFLQTALVFLFKAFALRPIFAVESVSRRHMEGSCADVAVEHRSHILVRASVQAG